MQRKIIWIVLLVLVVIGIVYSVKDYRNWRHAELDKYGQGYADARTPAMTLPNLYENKWAGVRMRYPKGSEMIEERTAKFATDTFESQAVWEKPVEIAKWGEMMVLEVTKSKETLPDTAVVEKNKIEKVGRMLREAEGLHLDTADEGRILTWEVSTGVAEQIVYQEALVKRGNKIVRLIGKITKSEWPKWEKTWLAIFNSMVLF